MAWIYQILICLQRIYQSSFEAQLSNGSKDMVTDAKLQKPGKDTYAIFIMHIYVA